MLFRAVHKALSAIQNNGVSAFQREVYTGRIGPMIGTLESVCIVEVSAFQGCPQCGVPLYKMQNNWYKWNRTTSTVYVYAYCMQTVPRTQNIEQKHPQWPKRHTTDIRIQTRLPYN